MTATTPETKVKAKIDAILKPYRQSGHLWYNKTAGSMFGTNGAPDYLGCYLGHMFAIEAKAGKGKTTALQDAQIECLRQAGATVFVINETNLHVIEAYLRDYS